MRKSEEICEIEFWRKNLQKRVGSLQVNGALHVQYRYGEISLLLVILLGLASQIKIFGDFWPHYFVACSGAAHFCAELPVDRLLRLGLSACSAVDQLHSALEERF